MMSCLSFLTAIGMLVCLLLFTPQVIAAGVIILIGSAIIAGLMGLQVYRENTKH